jgi:hypothetical protein
VPLSASSFTYADALSSQRTGPSRSGTNSSELKIRSSVTMDESGTWAERAETTKMAMAVRQESNLV